MSLERVARDVTRPDPVGCHVLLSQAVGCCGVRWSRFVGHRWMSSEVRAALLAGFPARYVRLVLGRSAVVSGRMVFHSVRAGLEGMHYADSDEGIAKLCVAV